MNFTIFLVVVCFFGRHLAILSLKCIWFRFSLSRMFRSRSCSQCRSDIFTERAHWNAFVSLFFYQYKTDVHIYREAYIFAEICCSLLCRLQHSWILSCGFCVTVWHFDLNFTPDDITLKIDRKMLMFEFSGRLISSPKKICMDFIVLFSSSDDIVGIST